jgi:hypothetical protein
MSEKLEEKVKVVVAWHNPEQIKKFCEAWRIDENDPRVVFQQDINHEGCAATKNKGILKAMEYGADVVVVLDDDCYSANGQTGFIYRWTH